MAGIAAQIEIHRREQSIFTHNTFAPKPWESYCKSGSKSFWRRRTNSPIFKFNRDVVERFRSVDLTSKKVPHVVEEETSHGRVERREYFQTTLPADFPESQRWPGIKTTGMVTRTHREIACFVITFCGDSAAVSARPPTFFGGSYPG